MEKDSSSSLIFLPFFKLFFSIYSSSLFFNLPSPTIHASNSIIPFKYVNDFNKVN